MCAILAWWSMFKGGVWVVRYIMEINISMQSFKRKQSLAIIFTKTALTWVNMESTTVLQAHFTRLHVDHAKSRWKFCGTLLCWMWPRETRAHDTNCAGTLVCLSVNLIETTGGVRIHLFVLFNNAGPHYHQYKLNIQLCDLRCRALLHFC